MHLLMQAGICYNTDNMRITVQENDIKGLLRLWRGEVICLDTVDSTNIFAKGTDNDCVVIAAAQTHGRGRLDRPFASTKGGLYMTVRISVEDEEVLAYPVLASLAVAEALDEVLGETYAEIKWPNDILIGGRKICGILTELIHVEDIGVRKKAQLLVGIGVNVRNELPDDLPLAGNIRELTGREIDINRLAALIADNLKRVFNSAPELKREYIKHVEKRCVTMGQEVFAAGPGVRGTAVRLDDSGAVILKTPDNREVTVSFGDVS
ncbi:MAG: biotin--[acetyl-CoA-carboxylase] ligase [Lachnospiraceae bacterium]